MYLAHSLAHPAVALAPSDVWLDVLCWNQHGRLSDPVAEWTPRVEKIGHQLTMLHPWWVIALMQRSSFGVPG